MFISLNSAEFCAKWIYGDSDPEQVEPVLSLEKYLIIWPAFQLLITAYIALFVPEVDPEIEAAHS